MGDDARTRGIETVRGAWTVAGYAAGRVLARLEATDV